MANSSSSNLASSNGHGLNPLVADAMVTDVLYASLKSGMTSDCVTGRCLLQIIQLSTARERTTCARTAHTCDAPTVLHWTSHVIITFRTDDLRWLCNGSEPCLVTVPCFVTCSSREHSHSFFSKPFHTCNASYNRSSDCERRMPAIEGPCPVYTGQTTGSLEWVCNVHADDNIKG